MDRPSLKIAPAPGLIGGTKMLSLKLLVVEDDPASLELMSEVLRSLEAEVRPFSNSQEAAALVHRQKFDGIFLDLEMPNLMGCRWPKKCARRLGTGRPQSL